MQRTTDTCVVNKRHRQQTHVVTYRPSKYPTCNVRTIVTGIYFHNFTIKPASTIYRNPTGTRCHTVQPGGSYKKITPPWYNPHNLFKNHVKNRAILNKFLAPEEARQFLSSQELTYPRGNCTRKIS